MSKTDKTEAKARDVPPSVLVADGAALMARYGDQLDDAAMTDAAKQAVLLALWQIMVAFVDLGFSVKAGDKFAPESDIGLDDVLQYLIPEDTAHETVAPPPTDKDAEAQ